MNNLVIAEKYDAAEKIAYFLSDGKMKRVKNKKLTYFEFEKDGDRFFVVGLRGHIFELDYPENLNKWDLETIKKLPNSKPVKILKDRTIMDTVKNLDKDLVLIATDYDREGELIGVEVLENLDVKNVKRAKFSALSKIDIKNAFENLIMVDYKLSDSAESRQYIDLAWGAALTRFLSLIAERKGKNFISVGRVQSPTLSIIVERELEILKFVPLPYWNIYAYFFKEIEIKGSHEKNPFETEPAELYEKIKNENQGIVKKLESVERKSYPPPPFNTTEFLREATKLRLSVSRAMAIAEDLYTSGYISYPRTDNTVYPKTLNLINVLKNLEKSEFAEEVKEILQQEKIVPSRGKVSSTDHPPIYPVKVASRKKLKKEYWAVYELVVRRFLATVAPPAIIKDTIGEIYVKDEKFVVKGLKILSKGWLKYYPYIHINEKDLPDLTENEVLEIKKIELEKKMTEPPLRFTQANLIKEMERKNLGTKSTRAEIIEKLYERGFVGGNPVKPTGLGIALISSLKKNNVEAVSPEMTAKLEENMNSIANGELSKEEAISESNQMLDRVINELIQKQESIKTEIKEALFSDQYFGKCPVCGSDIILLRSKHGRFLKCTSEKCSFKASLPKTGKIEKTELFCPVCNLPIIKVLRKGQNVELRCLDPKCEYNTNKETLAKCPKCENNLLIRQSKNGKRFLGCSNYPSCKVTYSLPQKGELRATFENCPICKAPLIYVKYKDNDKKICVNYKCEYNKTGDKT